MTMTMIITGYCSRCRKIWTLDTASGICQWCGKQANRQTPQAQARSIKTRARPERKQPASNGYDQLPEPHLTYYKVASRFSHKSLAEDKEDLLHDIIITLADIASHKPLSKPAMYRIASVTVANYWRTHYRFSNGLDCGSCSKAQRRKCKDNDLYNQCPKAIKLEYLSRPMIDSAGNMTELGELIADDTAIDLDQWLDAKAYLLGCKPRLITIAEKVRDGVALNTSEQVYLWRYRHTTQKGLFS